MTPATELRVENLQAEDLGNHPSGVEDTTDRPIAPAVEEGIRRRMAEDLARQG